MRTASVGALSLVVLGVLGCRQGSSLPPQPVSFDHRIHLRVRLDTGLLACVDCHPGAERGTHAGLPPLAYCLRCHMRPQGEPPSKKERQVRIAAKAGGEFRWHQITRNPGHVYFSHAPHVTLAGMKCKECHANVPIWSVPPTAPNEALTSMRKCMACHRARGAPTECGTCHK